MNIDRISYESLFKLVGRSWSSQIQNVIRTIIIIILQKTYHIINDTRFRNDKIEFYRDIIHVKKIVYMTSASFKGHMYTTIHEFIIINLSTSNVDLLLHLESHKLIDVFLIILELSATWMKLQEKVLEYHIVVTSLRII